MRTVSFCAAVVLLLGTCVGCNSDKTADAVAAMNTSNIQRISNMYAAFQNMKSGGGPKDEAEFKQFIREFAPNKLEMMKIDPSKLDELFTSERDQKPFKVRYKVGGGRGSVDAVVFEQEGVGGRKQVGYTGGKVEEVDDATYAQLWSGKSQGNPQAKVDPKAIGRPKGGPPPGAPKGPGK